MAKYNTRQKSLLLAFLRKQPNASFTAEEVAERLSAAYGEEAPGKSTVYRLLATLAEEEQVRSFTKKGNRRSYYQSADCNHEHLHLKCTDCGRLIHMKEDSTHQLLRQILLQSQFAVDEHQTVLFGRCGACIKEEV